MSLTVSQGLSWPLFHCLNVSAMSVSRSVRSRYVRLVVVAHGNVDRLHTDTRNDRVHQLHPQLLVLDVAVLHRYLKWCIQWASSREQCAQWTSRDWLHSHASRNASFQSVNVLARMRCAISEQAHPHIAWHTRTLGSATYLNDHSVEHLQCDSAHCKFTLVFFVHEVNLWFYRLQEYRTF